MKLTTNQIPLWNRLQTSAKTLAALALFGAVSTVAQAQITFTPVFTNVWNATAGITNPPGWGGLPANSGNNCRGIGINPVTTNALYFSSTGGTNNGGSHVGVISFASSGNISNSILGNLNGSGVSGGTVGTEGVRVADDGTVYGINLSGSPASQLKIYKWPSDSDLVTAPVNVSAVVSGSSFQWRAGDYSDLRGSGINTEIVVVGNGSGANLTTNFVVFRPTDASCTSFTNFTITIPGSVTLNYCGAGVAFEGPTNAIWIRRAGSQETRHIVYNPATLTAICDRTNNVDQSVCQGLKYYEANGVRMLATVQPSTANGANQIARVFQIPAALTGSFVSVLSSNIPAVVGSVNGNGLGNVDARNGYFVFGAPGHGVSMFNVTFATNSPPSSVTIGSSVGTVVAGFGINAVLTGTASGSAPLSFQWFSNTNGTSTNTLTAATTNNIYTVSNLNTLLAGTYFYIVTNANGRATSGVVTLAVLPNGTSTFATNLWSLAPGSRPYLTGAGTDTQRGLGYDANSNRVVLVTRTSHTNLNDGVTVVPFGAILLNANTGAEAGELDMTTLWGTTPAGTHPIAMCGVADDGIVYVCNLITSGNADTFAIYSWPSADPLVAMNGTPAYYANPLAGAGTLGRIGDSMAVRGAGTNTQIVCTFRNGTNAAVFTTADGVNFNFNLIAVTNLTASAALTDPFTGSSPLALGVAFGSGNTFWAKSSQYNLRQIGFDLATGQGWVLGSYPITGTSAPLGVNNVGGYVGIIGHNELPMNLAFYNLNDTAQLTTANISDRELFGTGTNSIANGNGTGNVAFDTQRARAFALSSNNGILAVQVSKATAAIAAVPAGGTVTWTGPGILQSATIVNGPYADVVGAISTYTNTGASQLFFRVKR